MAFFPILLGAVGAAALVLPKMGKKDEPAAQALRPGAPELLQGHTYTVQLTIDSPKMGTQNVATASAVIKSTFEQLGWLISSTPTTRGPGETANFNAGKASQWIFQGRWNKAEKFMPQGPPWLGMAAAYEAPVAAR